MASRLILSKSLARRFLTIPRGATTAVGRFASTRAGSSGSRSGGYGNAGRAFGLGALAVGVAGVAAAFADAKHSVGDYDAVRADIIELLDDNDYDDGSWAPTMIRLAWHASGTYDKKSKTGGSDGGTMRHSTEANDGANAGLEKARARLEHLKAKYPWISYGDLWTLAGVTALEEIGGPKITWRPGRTDKGPEAQPPNGRLPDAAKGPGKSGVDHIRDIFYRMGFNDQEIVALIGAHAVGRCHPDRSGYDGPWDHSPITFSNVYYQELLENFWTPKTLPNGHVQFKDPKDEIMMLPADLALLADPEFKKWVVTYAKDQDKFFNDFATAFGKLLDLGVNREKSWWR